MTIKTHVTKFGRVVINVMRVHQLSGKVGFITGLLQPGKEPFSMPSALDELRIAAYAVLMGAILRRLMHTVWGTQISDVRVVCSFACPHVDSGRTAQRHCTIVI
jgi:hypothetical protein